MVMVMFVSSLGKSLLLFLNIYVLPCWVQDSVDGMLFSWIWCWKHIFVFVNKTMNSFINFLISNILLLTQAFQVLECWVQMSIISMFFSWIWCWEHIFVIINKSMYLWINFLITNILLNFLCKSFLCCWFV